MSDLVDWTPHESALWWTCNFIRDLVRFDRRPPAIPVPFAMQMSREEFVYQWGTFQRSWFGPAGDGSYQNSWLVLGGSGPLGIALGALTLGGSAARNASRKAQAQQDTMPRWQPLDAGTIYVSTHGYYLETMHQLLPFSLDCHLRAEIAGPGFLQLTASMADGSQHNYAVSTVWAELIFVTWAMQHCPNHPQLHNLGWLPREFIQRVRYSGSWATSPLPELMTG